MWNLGIVKVKELYENPPEYDGMKITVRGWVKTIRDLKSFGFAELSDGSCFNSVQIVL